MPCRDDRDDMGSAYEELNTVKPALCGILSVLVAMGSAEAVLNAVDWKEAGITRDSFMIWWERHKQRDAERRQQEAQQAPSAMFDGRRVPAPERRRLQASGASKLTIAEKAALGIKD